MKRSYEKPFGTFTLEIEKGKEKVKLTATVNGTTVNCSHLDEAKQAVCFYGNINIRFNGKDIPTAGINLPDFTEVLKEYNIAKTELKTELIAKKEQAIEEIKNGTKTIKLQYQEGEYLSGYTCTGIEAKLLEDLGIATFVDGWGTHIKSEYVGKLGEEFLYTDAVKAIVVEVEKENAIIEKENELKELAKTTGTKQLLSSHAEECNNKNEDCSLDWIYEYAMPDGILKTERTHTY